MTEPSVILGFAVQEHYVPLVSEALGDLPAKGLRSRLKAAAKGRPMKPFKNTVPIVPSFELRARTRRKSIMQVLPMTYQRMQVGSTRLC